jgi:hypothetical protein
VQVSRTAGRATYSLNANRDIGFSIFVDNAYYVATQFGVAWITRRTGG